MSSFAAGSFESSPTGFVLRDEIDIAPAETDRQDLGR